MPTYKHNANTNKQHITQLHSHYEHSSTTTVFTKNNNNYFVLKKMCLSLQIIKNTNKHAIIYAIQNAIKKRASQYAE